jgi:hypothetical protein
MDAHMYDEPREIQRAESRNIFDATPPPIPEEQREPQYLPGTIDNWQYILIHSKKEERYCCIDRDGWQPIFIEDRYK